jgi:hypothetical protein
MRIYWNGKWEVFATLVFLLFGVVVKIVRQDEDRDTCVSKVLGFLFINNTLSPHDLVYISFLLYVTF